MENEAKEGIELDTMRDDALNPDCKCEICALARLCDRQRLLIAALTEQVAALKEELAGVIKGER
jgi:hypothetical protein